MRILALEHDLVHTTRPDLHDILRAEAAAVWDLQKRGVIRDIWFTASRRRAIILLECTGALEARNHLAELPLVRQGLSEFELLELTAYDGFERLFGAGLAPATKHEEPAEY
jgi:muconolactone delta-isomerase